MLHLNKVQKIIRETSVLKQINYLGYLLYPVLVALILFLFRDNIQATLLRLVISNVIVFTLICYILTKQSDDNKLMRAIVSLRNSILISSIIWQILFNKQSLGLSSILLIFTAIAILFIYLFYSKLVKPNNFIENLVSLLTIFVTTNFLWIIKEFSLINTDFILILTMLVLAICLLAWLVILKLKISKDILLIISLIFTSIFFGVFWHEYYFYSALNIYISSTALLITALSYTLFGIYYQDISGRLTKKVLVEYSLVGAIILASETVKVIFN